MICIKLIWGSSRSLCHSSSQIIWSFLLILINKGQGWDYKALRFSVQSLIQLRDGDSLVVDGRLEDTALKRSGEKKEVSNYPELWRIALTFFYRHYRKKTKE